MPRKRLTVAVLALAALVAIPATAPAATKKATTTKKKTAVTKAAATTVAPAAATTAPATTAAPAAAEPAMSLDALVEAAKKEGKLTLYTTANAVQVDPAVAAFQQRYPGIKVTWSRTSTPELIQKFAAEASAGVNAVDIVHMTDSLALLDEIKQGLALPLNKSGIPGWPGKFPIRWILNGGQLAMQTMSPSGFAYNTSQVKGNDIPTTYNDFIGPAWKGKIIALDPTTAGSAIWDFWDFMLETFGARWLSAFKDNNPIWYATAVPGAQANAAGEAPLFIPAFPSLTSSMKAAKAPVEQVVPEETTGVLYAAVAATKAPHQNAAKLFLYDMYTAPSADAFAQIPDQVSPFGGGMAQLPRRFKLPNSVRSATTDRKAEIAKLLGLKYP
jgi:iron(III) transport system substrate-binding protein